ncbi:MAG: O-antigen ligase family protein [Patescibacteria group bacterium]|nr:O-antigen ligase family protein [Patescibacteria group bacterium]
MTLFILLTLLFALFIFLSWQNIQLALGLLFLCLPSYLIRFNVGFLPTTVLELMILAIFLTWLVKKLIRHERVLIIKKWFWIILMWLLGATLALLVSADLRVAAGIWKAYFIEPIIIFIILIDVIQKRRDINLIMHFLSVSVVSVALLAIYQKITGWLVPIEFWQDGRMTSFFGYPNAIGLYVAPIVILLLAQIKEIFKNKKDLKWGVFYLITIILGIISLVLAKSEGAVVGLLAGIIFLALLSGPRERKTILIIIILAILMISFYQPWQEYAREKITLNDLSGQIRRQQWKETWQMLQDGRILSGSGLASYQIAIEPYHQDGIFFNAEKDPDFKRKIILFSDEYKAEHWQPVEIYLYPHNIILNFWTELGLAGLSIFILCLLEFFKTGGLILKNKKNYLVIGLMASMIVILIHGLVDVPYFKNDLAILWWLFIGLITILDIKYQTRYEN